VVAPSSVDVTSLRASSVPKTVPSHLALPYRVFNTLHRRYEPPTERDSVYERCCAHVDTAPRLCISLVRAFLSPPADLITTPGTRSPRTPRTSTELWVPSTMLRASIPGTGREQQHLDTSRSQILDPGPLQSLHRSKESYGAFILGQIFGLTSVSKGISVRRHRPVQRL
jgi:hypothetical protein